MTVFTSLTVWLVLSAVLLLHIASVVLPSLYAKIAIFVNIALHIALVWVLLAIKAPLDETVVICMISVFFYTLLSFVKYKRRGGGSK